MADLPNNPLPPASPDPLNEPQSPSWVYSGLPTGLPPNAPKPPAPVSSLPPLSSEPGWIPGEPVPPTPRPISDPPAAPAPMVPPAAPKPVARKAAPTHDDASLAGIIDTIEAIIIALIVALTFRAFIVEAFVIPTGSMAPTLLGAHYRVICPKCGYEFNMDADLGFQVHDDHGTRFIAANRDPQAELGSNRGVPMEQPAICPNCRFQIAAKEMPQYLESPHILDMRQGPPPRPVDLVWANNGDRILVLKYLYSVMEPKHWDVIVFKEPQLAQNNYIKRLIGLPYETVQIINGDIYINGMISRKPEELQPALWQLVYNNEFYPSDEGKPRAPLPYWDIPVWSNPWEPDPARAADWKKGPVMTYTGAGAGSLQFHPLPPGAPPGFPPYGLNTLGYNSDLFVDDMIAGAGEFAPRSVVGDLRLETRWTPHDAAGRTISLTLGRPNNCFRITWGPLGMELSKFNPEKQSWSTVDAATVHLPGIGAGGSVMPAPEINQTYELAFNNVDHAVAFYVDGKKIMWFEQAWTANQAIEDVTKYPADWTNSPSQGPATWEAPNKARVNTMIQIDVGGPCDISHLKLFRDLYYTQVSRAHQIRFGWHGTGIQDNPITLGKDEFFAMGDNSRRSSDGRLWSTVHDPLGDLGVRPGVVPRRYLLGKAFFVYWPAGFTPVEPKSDVPFLNSLPLVPNTGDMRIIR